MSPSKYYKEPLKKKSLIIKLGRWNKKEEHGEIFYNIYI